MNINDFAVLKNWDTKKFVVTIPTTKNSLEVDILFSASPYDLVLQIAGGLNPGTIFLITSNEEEAKRTARALLELKFGKSL